MNRWTCLLTGFFFLFSADASLAYRPKLALPAPAGVLQANYVVEASTNLGGEKMQQPRNIVAGAAVTYAQDFGGAGVAGGLLFGPFGVLANAKAIDSHTVKDAVALQGKLPLDPVALLQSALTARQPGTANGGSVALTPSVFVTKNEAEELMFRVVLNVRHEAWKGRYMIALPDRITLANASAGLSDEAQAGLRNSVVAAYAEALGLLERDARGELNNGSERKMYVEALSPRFKFTQANQVVAESDDRIVIRGMDVSKLAPAFDATGGVISVAKKEVQAK